jgi:HK97 family phage major capsid protein
MENTKMSNLKALRQRYADQKRALQALLDAAAKDDRDLAQAETQVYESGIKKLETIAKSIEKEEQLADVERNAPAYNVATGKLETPRAPIPFRGDGKLYREMFGATDGGSGFKDLNEFLQTVHGGMNDHRFSAVAQGMGGNVPTDGGFLVPTEFSAEMLDASLESEIVRPRATVYPMKSATRQIAGLDASDNSSSAPYGGLSIQWANEGDTGSNKKTKARLIQLTAQKAMLFVFGSNELIADGLSWDQMIGNAIVKSLGWGLDYAFLNGDGAGKPKGVLSDPALVVVSKESSQAGSTILYANVAKMFARLHPACLGNSVWIANSTTLPQLLQMQLVVSNRSNTENVGGSAVPVVSQVNGKFTMLGRPVIFTEKLPALTNQGDILLTDLSQYAVGLRKEVSLERSIYAGWQTDESGYRAIVRVDGQGTWKSAFTPKNGDSLSWCVTLQAR